jgi:hypothetical protein
MTREGEATLHNDMMPWAPAAGPAVAQRQRQPVPVAAFDFTRRRTTEAIFSLVLCVSTSLLPQPPPLHHRALFRQVPPASAADPPPALPAAQPLTVEQALDQILTSCDPAFLSAVLQSGRFLYRGESSILTRRDADAGASAGGAAGGAAGGPAGGAAALLCPPPDLLVAGTYGEDHDADAYFQTLERVALGRSPVKPSNGHIGVARREAAASWGQPSSVWPIGGALHYAWPAARQNFWPLAGPAMAVEGAGAYRVDVGLVQALKLGREVLFATDGCVARQHNLPKAEGSRAPSSCVGSAYIAINAELDTDVWRALQQRVLDDDATWRVGMIQ